MDTDHTASNWQQFKGKLKEQWGELTDDDLDVIEGRRDQLLGRIQARHGVEPHVAEQQFTDWHARNPSLFFEKS